MLYVISADGRCVERNGTVPTPPIVVFEEKYGPVTLVSMEVDPYSLVPIEHLLAVVEDGQVIGVKPDAAWTLPPDAWLFVELTGGQVNLLTGERYVRRGDMVQFGGYLRAANDPAAPVLGHVPGTDPPVPVSGEWAVDMPHEDGLDLFCPQVTLVEGVASGTMEVPARLVDGTYALREDRLAMVGPFRVRLGNPEAARFKVRS